MPALSDNLLAGGCALHVEAVHGEPVVILSGPDAGKTFTAVREVEADVLLTSDLGSDPRAKIVLRFRENATPAIVQTGQVQTADGRKWFATRRQEAGFLTNDYELTEKTAKDQ